jgi:hypothetical protein
VICLLWAILLENDVSSSIFRASFFTEKSCFLILTKNVWATFWATFHTKHLVTLSDRQKNVQDGVEVEIKTSSSSSHFSSRGLLKQRKLRNPSTAEKDPTDGGTPNPAGQRAYAVGEPVPEEDAVLLAPAVGHHDGRLGHLCLLSGKPSG